MIATLMGVDDKKTAASIRWQRPSRSYPLPILRTTWRYHRRSVAYADRFADAIQRPRSNLRCNDDTTSSQKCSFENVIEKRGFGGCSPPIPFSLPVPSGYRWRALHARDDSSNENGITTGVGNGVSIASIDAAANSFLQRPTESAGDTSFL